MVIPIETNNNQQIKKQHRTKKTRTWPKKMQTTQRTKNTNNKHEQHTLTWGEGDRKLGSREVFQVEKWFEQANFTASAS